MMWLLTVNWIFRFLKRIWEITLFVEIVVVYLVLNLWHAYQKRCAFFIGLKSVSIIFEFICVFVFIRTDLGEWRLIYRVLRQHHINHMMTTDCCEHFSAVSLDHLWLSRTGLSFRLALVYYLEWQCFAKLRQITDLDGTGALRQSQFQSRTRPNI